MGNNDGLRTLAICGLLVFLKDKFKPVVTPKWLITVMAGLNHVCVLNMCCNSYVSLHMVWWKWEM